MTTSTFKTCIIVLLTGIVIIVLYKGCNDLHQARSVITSLQYDTADNNAKNRVLLNRVFAYERQELVNDSLGKIKKDEQRKKPVKQKIDEVVKSIPGAVKTSDTTFTAGEAFADTLAFLRIDLKTCYLNSALKDSSIIALKQVHVNDSLTIDKVVSKGIKAEKKVKRLSGWLRVVGGAAVVSTLIVVLTLP